MPRIARVFVKNACYHIVARGIQNDDVFRNPSDFRNYLRLVHKYKIKTGCRIYCYCLMDNHVHFILESPLGIKAMATFMHGIGMSHALSFNGKYNRTGHLWQNRYKSFVVLKDDYIINLFAYIEHNPVRAKMVARPEDYAWSSYKARMLGEKDIIVDELALVGTGVG
jgi:putative transposase